MKLSFAFVAILALVNASSDAMEGKSEGACEGDECEAEGAGVAQATGLLQKKSAGKMLETAHEDALADEGGQEHEEAGETEELEVLYVSAEEADANARRRTRLVIESDLSKLGDEHFLAFDSAASCAENAKVAFDHFADKSGVAKELTGPERAAFKKRFLSEMDWDCKNDPQVVAHWALDVRNAVEHEKPVVTKAQVDSYNAAHLGFESKMHEWMVHLSSLNFKRMLGDREVNSTSLMETENKQHFWGRRRAPAVPSTHDSRAKFPHCRDVIEKVHNQGLCGSCWAFAALSSLDSRICIHTGGEFSGPRAQLSRGYLTSCAYDDGCQGGNGPTAYEFFAGGIVTGGQGGCVPYYGTGNSLDHFDARRPRAPPCQRSCANRKSISSVKFSASGVASYDYTTDAATAKSAIYKDGPVYMSIKTPASFMGYSRGIFSDCNGPTKGGHGMAIFGWGSGYWIGVNSWGTYWGMRGLFYYAERCASAYTIPGPMSGTNFRSILPLPGTPKKSYTWREAKAPCAWWQFWC